MMALRLPEMMVQLPLGKTLRNGKTVQLDQMQEAEGETVRSLFNAVVVEGQTYPQKHPLSEAEFAAYWLVGDAFVVRSSPPFSLADQTKILAAFFIKPNFPGRCAHICNAGFIVQPEMRGLGIGRLMGEALLELAPNLGYSAIMFNLVFATNTASICLWKSLNFEIIGRIPNAVQLDDQTIDALIFYRSLL
ncbi:N-acetyltransferase family protein [Phormidesmis priestleyi]